MKIAGGNLAFVLTCMFAASSTSALGQSYPINQYQHQNYVAPVFIEPGAVDPYAGATADVVLTEAPSLPSHDPFLLEESESRQDLGNLIPPGTRNSFFQKVNLASAWMPQFESDGLGMTMLKANVVTAVPFPKRHQPLTITPEYTVRFLEGPDFIDVPSRLHDAELKFNHLRRVSDRWIFNAGITLGTYADDDSFDSSDAFRVSGRALGIYEVDANTRWILGVVYLNRAGASVVPAVGWTFKTDDLAIDVVFPQPRIAWRTWCQGAPGYNERWFYVQGEFGGGIWAVRRASGASDNLSYSDYRILVGTERKIVGGLSRRWEFGYIFGRELEYDSVGSDIEIDDTVFVRAGLTY